jgi:hypothetical protein
MYQFAFNILRAPELRVSLFKFRPFFGRHFMRCLCRVVCVRIEDPVAGSIIIRSICSRSRIFKGDSVRSVCRYGLNLVSVGASWTTYLIHQARR